MQRPFKIAAVQTEAVAGDVAANVERHAALARLAARHQARVLVFPELSLTGYEPSLAASAALAVRDGRLQPLQHAADTLDITIVAGAPIRGDGKPFLGALIIGAQRPPRVYRKRFLHGEEADFFEEADECVVHASQGQRLGLAICADIHQPEHVRDAALGGATIYAAGVAITPDGIGKAERDLASHAREHRLLAVMANYGAATGGYPMAGRSAIWEEAGARIAQADAAGEALVIAEATSDGWQAGVFPVDPAATD